MPADDVTIGEVWRGLTALQVSVQGMSDRVAAVDKNVVAIGEQLRAHVTAQSERTRLRDVRCTQHDTDLGAIEDRMRLLEAAATTNTVTHVERSRIPNWVPILGTLVPLAAFTYEVFKH